MSGESAITIPPAAEIRRRIEGRRAEISALKRLLRISVAAANAEQMRRVTETERTSEVRR
jgi:hypothetical protein